MEYPSTYITNAFSKSLGYFWLFLQKKLKKFLHNKKRSKQKLTSYIIRYFYCIFLNGFLIINYN